MKSIKSLDIGSVVLYGAVLAALWTFAFGLYYWLIGWIFGISSTLIDMNLANWTTYTLSTFLTIIWRSLINALGGALAGLLIALVYNAVAGLMGGIKVELE
jgi:ABC-type Fe3+ transport system permease subunit